MSQSSDKVQNAQAQGPGATKDAPAGAPRNEAPGAPAPVGDGRYRLIFVLATLCVLVDQVSKWLVVQKLPLHQSLTVIPGYFDLVHVLNRGAAFGFLNRSDIDWQFWLFLLATVLAGGIILSITSQAKRDSALFWGFGLILGGAVGNLIDRVRLRAVIDFLDVYVGNWHWPAFNVADMAICVGAVLAGIALWRNPYIPKRR